MFFVVAFAYVGGEAIPGSFLFPINLPFDFSRVPGPAIQSWSMLFLVGKAICLLPLPEGCYIVCWNNGYLGIFSSTCDQDLG